jgi:hypothetical protein
VAAAHVYLPLAAVSHRFEVSALLLGALLVVGALAPGLARRSFLSLTSVTVFVSIIVHGATDTAGAEWITRRSERALRPD